MKRKDFLARLLELSEASQDYLSFKDIPLIQCRQPAFIKRIKAIQMGRCQINPPTSTAEDQQYQERFNRRVLILTKQKKDVNGVNQCMMRNKTSSTCDYAEQKLTTEQSVPARPGSGKINKKEKLISKMSILSQENVSEDGFVQINRAKSFAKEDVSFVKKMQVAQVNSFHKNSSIKRHSTSCTPSNVQKDNYFSGNPISGSGIIAQSINLIQNESKIVQNIAIGVGSKVVKFCKGSSNHGGFAAKQRKEEEERKAKLLMRKEINRNYGKPFNPPPKITAKSYIIWQIRDERQKSKMIVSFNSKNSQEVASLTKIMTCILILDIAKSLNISLPSQEVRVGKYEVGTCGTSAGIELGQIYTVQQLLFGLMLPSGNDASLALAVWGGRKLLDQDNIDKKAQLPSNQTLHFQQQSLLLYKAEFTVLERRYSKHQCYLRFVSEMNCKAGQLKMFKTNYSNSHGLSNPNNKSSAFDIAILSEYAMKNQDFRKIVRCRDYESVIKQEQILAKMQAENKNNIQDQCSTDSHSSPKRQKCASERSHCLKPKNIRWQNTHKLLQSRPDEYIGIKTGMTNTAGPCLSSCVSAGGRNFIIVVLGCARVSLRFKETQILKKWLFKQEGIQSSYKRKKANLKQLSERGSHQSDDGIDLDRQDAGNLNNLVDD